MSASDVSPQQKILDQCRIQLDALKTREPEAFGDLELPTTLSICPQQLLSDLLVEIVGFYDSAVAKRAAVDKLLLALKTAMPEPSAYKSFDYKSEVVFWEKAWHQPFVANIATEHFLAYLYQIGQSTDSDMYAKVVPFVQSSGTGKSRLLHEAATHFLTIPICLREKEDANGYPGGDVAVFDILCKFENGQKTAQWLRFLIALFKVALQKLELHCKRDSPQECILAWRSWLEDAAQRRNFYAEVKTSMQQSNQDPAPYATNPESHGKDISTARSLLWELAALVESHTYQPILLYFDEAHELDRGVTLHWLSSVFADIITLSNDLGKLSPPHIVVVASTQSSICHSTSSTGPPIPQKPWPRSRLWPPSGERHQLPRPWCGLARHVHWKGSMKDVADFTLADVRKFESVVAIGRPLWSSFYYAHPEERRHREYCINRVVKLAQRKVCMDVTATAALAALACRLGLGIDYSAAGSDFACELVHKSAATALYIPANRQYIAAAYPIEPLLGHGSALVLRSLNSSELISGLSGLMRDSKVGKGVRGEILTKYMLMRAYDLAYDTVYKSGTSAPNTSLHPITLEHFLQHLVGKKYTSTLLATPWNYGSEATLATFKSYNTILSQWIPAANIEAIESAAGLAAAIHFQCAIEGSTNWPAIDGFMVFTKDDAADLHPHNLVVLCFQTKCCESQSEVPPHYDSMIATWLEQEVPVIYIHHNVTIGDTPFHVNVTIKRKNPKRAANKVKKLKSEKKEFPTKAPLFYITLSGINPSIIEPDELYFFPAASASEYPHASAIEREIITQNAGMFNALNSSSNSDVLPEASDSSDDNSLEYLDYSAEEELEHMEEDTR